ncbi:MAG: translation initiation factor IF-3 [Candidatus Limnocylindrales bacterium]
MRLNQMIRVPQVRVLDEDGSQLGVMPTQQALAMAQERGLDLVEVAPTAAPPVVKFLDYGQYKYELTKREKEAKRKQRAVEFKEVRLTPKIGVGDFETKVHRAIEFLEDGDRIKVTVRFRGRELTHPEIGRGLLAKFGDRVKDHGTVDRTPALEGKSMFMTLASVHKPRVHEHKITGNRTEGEAPDDAPSQPQAESPQAPAEAAEPATPTAPAAAPVAVAVAEVAVEPATAPEPTPEAAPAAEAAPAGE